MIELEELRAENERLKRENERLRKTFDDLARGNDKIVAYLKEIAELLGLRVTA